MEKHQILDAYKLYWLENGKKPVSVYVLCKILNTSESEFYNHFNSLEAVDKAFWLELFNQTKNQLENDETYRNYNSREKLLAFYFLWVQKLKDSRSYILLRKDAFKLTDITDDSMELFKKAFIEYINNLVKSGYETQEIKERKFISDKYAHGFWLQALFVLKYWVDDKSTNFEMTDAAIEKAVDLSFRLIGEGVVDSLIDFGKFMFVKK